MDRFIGRKKELKFLRECYHSSKSELIPIYGRRRVGKSELINKFINGKPALYFVGKKEPSGMIKPEFLKEASRQLDIPVLKSVEPKTWKDTLELLAGQLNSSEKTVIVLDEFQWIAKTDPEIVSVLQEIWDSSWKKTGNIFLIICGSYMGFMEKEILGKKSPLYGRRTGQIKLMPFNYREAALFHPNYSLVDKVKTYMLCGGVPLYLKLFSDRNSVEINIRENYFYEFAPLFREAEFLLREELKEVEKYHGILQILASSILGIREISSKTGIDPRNVPYYLNQLINLGYVSKKYPLYNGKTAVKRVRYQIDDPVLKFWFKFVFPNMSYISQMGKKASFQHILKNNLDLWFGKSFETFCREALSFIYLREGVSTHFKTGEYWDKNVQIDVVGIRDDNWVDIGECKWGKVSSTPNLVSEIRRKKENFPNQGEATLHCRAFTMKNVKNKNQYPDVQFHDIEDLYK